MQVHLLVGVPAVVVGGHVAGDHHHRDAIEGGVGHAGGGVGETRAEVAENDRGPSGDTRVAVGGVRGDLFVPHVDELDAAVGHRGEDRDVGVSAETEDVADTAPFQIADELFGSGWVASAHRGTPDAVLCGVMHRRSGGSARRSGPRYEWFIGSIRRIGRHRLAFLVGVGEDPGEPGGDEQGVAEVAREPDLVEDRGHHAVDVDRHRFADRAGQRRLERRGCREMVARDAGVTGDRQERVEPGVAALVLAVAEAGYPLAVRPPVGDQIVGSGGQRTAARRLVTRRRPRR